MRSPEQRKQAMRNQSLRDKMMRGHAEKIATEVEQMTADWGEAGEIDLLSFFAELTLYTSSDLSDRPSSSATSSRPSTPRSS